MVLQPEYRSILVPWNFSANSERALAKALQVSGDSTRIEVVHVAAPLSGPDNGALFFSNECSHRGLLRKRFWRDLPEDLRDRRIRFDVEFGLVGRELMRFACRHSAELVILAKSRKSQLGRMLFGDVEAYLRKHSPCQIDLIAPPTMPVEARPDYSTRGGKVASRALG